MSVGVETLDHDHRHLIALLNRLRDMVGGAESQQAITDIVHDLVQYTEYHFESEERLMRLNQYPEIEAHIRMHRDLCRRLVSFEQKFRGSPAQENAAWLLDFLSEWLSSHILVEDMKYRPYMAEDRA